VFIEPVQFLTVPCLVVVGENDVARDAKLNQDPQVDARQGTTRMERGTRWVEAMRSAAREHRKETSYSFATLPGVGHSFVDCMLGGGARMGSTVFQYLFGP